MTGFLYGKRIERDVDELLVQSELYDVFYDATSETDFDRHNEHIREQALEAIGVVAKILDEGKAGGLLNRIRAGQDIDHAIEIYFKTF